MTVAGVRPWPCWAAIAAAAIAIGGCGGSGDEGSSSSASAPTATTSGATGAQATAGSGQVQLYFTAGEQFDKVGRSLPPGGSELVRATQALVSGPRDGDRAHGVVPETQIPDDVTVKRVTVSGDGTAVAELSPEFMNGIPADPRRRDDAQRQELNARLGQVTYTLTQFDGVEAARVVAGGAAVRAAIDRHDYAAPAKGPERVDRSRGAKTPDTRRVQKRLAKLRFLPRGAVDGVEGYRTEEAVIAFQAWNGLERDGIVGPATTAALAKAHRPRPKGSGPARRIEVYRDKGVALLIDGGDVRRAIHVSSGGPGTPTPAGTFKVFRKELRSWSVPFQIWLPYASYFNQGIAFHEYPDVPVYPASHGCVRVPSPEAKGVYRFASLGTVVVVI